MHRNQTFTVLIAALLSGCGHGSVEGRYVGRGETFFNSLTLGPEGSLEVVFVGGRHQGSYTVDGDRITITAPNGDQSVLTIDAAGCLAHQLIGTYCKDDGASVASSTAEIYEAEAEEGRIALEFGAARRVRVTMTPFAGSNAPERMSFDARYDVDGDHLIVRLPGDERLVLTRTGGSLEGRMNGETVRFLKR